MKDRAYAKINLSLDVFNVREDGYHDIKSIMVPINFYDELEINIRNEDSYYCNKNYIKFNEYNSVVKMIEIFKKQFNINDKYEVKLNKYIPIKAGLGGGTSDGASALRILKRLYKLEIDDQTLLDMCLKVGADVPFNYYNRPAIVSGIGDVIEPINIQKQYYVLLVKPKMGVSTKKAYDLLDMDICEHPDIDKLRDILINGKDLYGHLGNSLQQPAFILNSEIKLIIDKLLSLGARNVLMSGSGSCVFCIDEDMKSIKDIYNRMKSSKYYVRFTKTLN